MAALVIFVTTCWKKANLLQKQGFVDSQMKTIVHCLLKKEKKNNFSAPFLSYQQATMANSALMVWIGCASQLLTLRGWSENLFFLPFYNDCTIFFQILSCSTLLWFTFRKKRHMYVIRFSPTTIIPIPNVGFMWKSIRVISYVRKHFRRCCINIFKLINSPSVGGMPNSSNTCI